MSPAASTPRVEWRFWRWSESNRILAGFLFGGAAGLAANVAFRGSARLTWALDQVVRPIGEVFLRLIFMIVIPLIVSAFVLGVTGLESWARLKALGGRYVLIVLCTAVVLVGSGWLVERAIRPGRWVSEAQRAELSDRNGAEAARDEAEAKQFPGLLPALVDLIPDNPIRHMGQALTVHDSGMGLPAVLIFSAFFSVAILLGPAEHMEVVLQFFQGLFAVSMNIVSIALKLTPFCIVFVAFDFTARLGLDLIASLSMFLLTFYAVWLIAFAVVFPLSVRLLGGWRPLAFYRAIKKPFWYAFVTTSSSATYPVSLRTTTEEMALPESQVRFVLTLGAVANQVGASVSLVTCGLFLADIYGVPLSTSQQLGLLGLCVGFAFATPGVPGGILPLLATVCLLFGIPPRAVALIVSIDRLLDIGCTTINVTGDLVVATVLARSDRYSPLLNRK